MASWGVDGLVGIQLVHGQPSPDEIVDHVHALATATDLPVVLCTNPRLGADLPLSALERIVADETVQYLEDASGVTGRLVTIRSALGGRLRFFAASAHLPAAVLDLGGVGRMAGPACVAPAAAVALWDAHRRGDLARRARLQEAIWPLNALFVRHGAAPLVKLALDEAGAPSRDAVIRVSASSGSRKKSPDTLTRVRRSSSTSVSTTTSLPPGTLYSPCMPTIVGAPLTPSRAGRARRPCRRRRPACRRRAGRRRPGGGAASTASTGRGPSRRGGAPAPRRGR